MVNKHSTNSTSTKCTHLSLLLLGREEPLDRLLVLEHDRVGHDSAEPAAVVVAIHVLLLVALVATATVVAAITLVARERLGLHPQVPVQVQRLLAERVLAGDAFAPGALASLCAVAAHALMNEVKMRKPKTSTFPLPERSLQKVKFGST